MKKEKRFFEKFIIEFVFIVTFAVLAAVLIGVVSRVLNVERDNPVVVAEDYSYVTLDGRYFRSVSEVPEELRLVSYEYLKGARHEGSSKFNQAFRDRYIYAVYVDNDGKRYIWVKDGDFYKEEFKWADWSRDYSRFKSFEKSYFYKEQ